MLNLQKAHYAKQQIALRGIKVRFAAPTFNEFVIQLPKSVADVNAALLREGMIGGYDLGRSYPELANHMLVAVTELRTRAEIDHLAEQLEGIVRA